MNIHSDRLLLFPRVDEVRIKEDRREKVQLIRREIMADMKRNNTTSLYSLNEGKKINSDSSSKKKVQSHAHREHRHASGVRLENS